MRARLAFPVCATALAALVSGCGLFGGDDDGGDGGDNGDVENGTAPDTNEVIGEGTFEHEDSEVAVAINGLTERGDLLQLDYTLTYGDPDTDGESDNLFSHFGAISASGDIFLVDSANLNRHLVVEDADGNSLQPDPVDTRLAWGEPAQMTAYFASSEDMETVNVHLYGLPPIMDVPVTTSGEEGE